MLDSLPSGGDRRPAVQRGEERSIGMLEGKVAIVTGAGQGMGRAFAQILAEEMDVEWARAWDPGRRHQPRPERDAVEHLRGRAWTGGFASPEEIARVVRFLVSDEASHITADVLTVDGGWMAGGGIEEPVGA